MRKLPLRSVVITGLAASALSLGLVACGSDSSSSTTTKSSTSTTVTSRETGSVTTQTTAPIFTAAPPLALDVTKTYVADVTTDEGVFTMTFDTKNAPTTSNNFIYLAEQNYYNGVIFHRVQKDFVIQGGDPTGTGTGGPGYAFADEYLPPAGADGLSYHKYDVVMANSGPNTNGSQFFIVTGASGESLQNDYALFAHVTSGTDVIDKIAAGPYGDEIPLATAHKMISVVVKDS